MKFHKKRTIVQLRMVTEYNELNNSISLELLYTCQSSVQTFSPVNTIIV